MLLLKRVRIGCEVSRRVNPTSKTVPRSQKQKYEKIRRPILDNYNMEHENNVLPKINFTNYKEEEEDRGNSKICTSTEEEEEENFDC